MRCAMRAVAVSVGWVGMGRRGPALASTADMQHHTNNSVQHVIIDLQKIAQQ
jgi:hypothetical protein